VRHREIRLRRHDETESLKIGGYIHPAFAIVARQNLAQVHSPTLGRDRPQYIGQVLPSQPGGPIHVVEVDINGEPAFLAVDLSSAGDCGHEAGALELDHRRPATMPVIDRPGAARIHMHPEYGHLRVLVSRYIL